MQIKLARCQGCKVIHLLANEGKQCRISLCQSTIKLQSYNERDLDEYRWGCKDCQIFTTTKCVTKLISPHVQHRNKRYTLREWMELYPNNYIPDKSQLAIDIIRDTFTAFETSVDLFLKKKIEDYGIVDDVFKSLAPDFSTDFLKHASLLTSMNTKRR
jgi:hypothetical protein